MTRTRRPAPTQALGVVTQPTTQASAATIDSTAFGAVLPSDAIPATHGKLANMRTILMRYGRAGVAGLDNGVARLLTALGQIETLNDPTALLGLEGTASADYFAALGAIIDPPFTFRERNRRPPRDPVNERGRQTLLRRFHARMKETVDAGEVSALPYERVLMKQAQVLAACIRAGEPQYVPFLVK